MSSTNIQKNIPTSFLWQCQGAITDNPTALLSSFNEPCKLYVMLLGSVLVVHVLSIHSWASQTEVESSLPNRLYSCPLSLSYLSVCLSHTPILVYMPLVTENSSVFNLCCTLTIHSSTCLQTHHSTDHLLIPQAHAIIPLHLYLGFFPSSSVWTCWAKSLTAL